jgi:hypothetical protein
LLLWDFMPSALTLPGPVVGSASISALMKSDADHGGLQIHLYGMRSQLDRFVGGLETIRKQMDRKMRWLLWYWNPTCKEIMGILFLLAMVVSLFVFVLAYPNFRPATGFGPDWDCDLGAKGVCIKKLSR